MFLGRVLALALLAMWLWPMGLHAQSDELIAAFTEGKAWAESGLHEEAIPFNIVQYPKERNPRRAAWHFLH